MRRKRRGGLLVALAVGAVLSGGPFACSSSAQLSPMGGACTVVTDCQDGLVCCSQGKNAPTCSNDVMCLEPSGSAQADAANPGSGQGDGASQGDDAAQGQMTGVDATQQETGAMSTPEAEAPETGKAPVDSGKPEETGSTPQEASAPPVDAGAD